MIIACIGDSLTEGDYGVLGKRGIANVKEENYPYFLEKLSGCVTLNYGKCGYTATSYLKHYLAGNANVKNADVVLVMLGSNGGHSSTEETEGNLNFQKLLDEIGKDAENAQVVLITPPHVTENPEFSNCGYKKQVDEAVLFVRRLAQERGLPLIEGALIDEFNEQTEHLYQSNDGLHFNRDGYEIMAKYIFEGLKKLQIL